MIEVENSSCNLQFWNVWGLDNVGRINSDNNKYFYLKDHLGSVRVVIDMDNSIVSAQDYDAWGYIMQNRTWQSENARYKFTGKERDKDLENNYDYFGARYYDSRIGNWTGTDPLFEKHYDYSPYNYVLRNPLIYIDPKGEQVRSYLIGGESLDESIYWGQYKEVYEANLASVQRETRSQVEWLNRPRETGVIETPFIDPVDVFAGAIGFKLALTTAIGTTERILAREVTKEVTEYAYPKLARQLEKQVIEHGEKTILKSLKSIEKRLGEHVEKLPRMKIKSRVETDIKTFEKSIETLKKFIKEKGIK